MKRLNKKFTSRGFDHVQIKRINRRAIYKRTPKDQPSSRPHYEVIMIGSHNGYKLGGSYIKPAETYPSSSMWGIAGWTCPDELTANEKFENIGKYTA